MEFEKQSEIMDMKEEMMNDAIDDAMGDEDDEDERWARACLHWVASVLSPSPPVQGPVGSAGVATSKALIGSRVFCQNVIVWKDDKGF